MLVEIDCRGYLLSSQLGVSPLASSIIAVILLQQELGLGLLKVCESNQDCDAKIWPEERYRGVWCSAYAPSKAIRL